MPAEPVPADPGRDDDLAWLDRDPATAQEREAWLDPVLRARRTTRAEEECKDFAPLTAEELAEVEGRRDDLLAVEAATTGRRGPGQPGSARVFPGRVVQPGGVVRAGDDAGCAAGLRGPGGRRRRRRWG